MSGMSENWTRPKIGFGQFLPIFREFHNQYPCYMSIVMLESLESKLFSNLGNLCKIWSRSSSLLCTPLYSFILDCIKLPNLTLLWFKQTLKIDLTFFATFFHNIQYNSLLCHSSIFASSSLITLIFWFCLFFICISPSPSWSLILWSMAQQAIRSIHLILQEINWCVFCLWRILVTKWQIRAS